MATPIKISNRPCKTNLKELLDDFFEISKDFNCEKSADHYCGPVHVPN